jgi:hypothetical protein
MRGVPWIPGLVLATACVQWVLAAWANYVLEVRLPMGVMAVDPERYFHFAVPVTIALACGLYLPLLRAGRLGTRLMYRKPVVYDEVRYEGDSKYRWGNLSGQDLVHRFWSGTVVGTYVGHGDYFYRDETDTWTSFGGKLVGESAPRLAFLRKIMEDGPALGIDPIDKWWDVRTGGQPGQYYLIYFGRETPAKWAFELYKNGVTDGQRYAVDVIDTAAQTLLVLLKPTCRADPLVGAATRSFTV